MLNIFNVTRSVTQKTSGSLGAPRWEPNDRKRVRSSAPLVALRGAPKGRVGHSVTGMLRIPNISDMKTFGFRNYAAAFAGTGISQYSIRETTGKIIKKNAK